MWLPGVYSYMGVQSVYVCVVRGEHIAGPVCGLGSRAGETLPYCPGLSIANAVRRGNGLEMTLTANNNIRACTQRCS